MTGVSAALGEAYVNIRGNLKTLGKDLDGAEKLIESKLGVVGSSMKSLAPIGAAAAVGIGAVAAAIGGATVALVKFGQYGATIQPTVAAFDRLTASVGETSSAMLGATRTATKGLITDLEVMQAANKGILLGLPVTSQSMSTMAETAIVLGKAMGQGPNKSLDDLITALGRSSPMILDNLGLSVKVGEANEKYAAALGKTAKELTDAEKKQAFFNAAMEAAEAKVAALGGVQLNAADHALILKNRWSNLVDQMAVSLVQSPVIVAGFQSITDSLNEAFGTDQSQLVTTLMGYVERFAIFLVDVGRVGVLAAQGIAIGFAGLKSVFLAVSTVVAGVITGIAGAATAVLNLATKIPGVGDQFEGAAAAAQAFADTTAESTLELAGMTAEASKGIIGQDGFGQALSGAGAALTDMKARMEAARNSQRDLTETSVTTASAQDDLTTSTEDVAEASKKAKEAVDAQAEALRSLGFLTGGDVTTEVMRLQGAISAAAREGAGPLRAAIGGAIERLLELRDKAIASGQSVAFVDSTLQALRETARSMDGPLPTMNQHLRDGLPLMHEWGSGLQVITAEQMRAQTESTLLASAYETLGLKTAEELHRAADEARVAYDRILASGTATKEQLAEAAGRLADAEIAAGRRVERSQSALAQSMKAQLDNIVRLGKGAFRALTDQVVGFNSRLNEERKQAADQAREEFQRTEQDAKESLARTEQAARESYDRTVLAAEESHARELTSLDETYRDKVEMAGGNAAAIQAIEIWYAKERNRIEEEKNAAIVEADQTMRSEIETAAAESNTRIQESHEAMQLAIEEASHPWRDRMIEVWNSLKTGFKDILSQMLSEFIHSFLAGMLQGLNAWATQAGSIFSRVFSMGAGGIPVPTVGSGGAGAAVGTGVGVGSTAMAVGLTAAAVAPIAIPWAVAALGPHGNDAMATAQMEVDEFLAGAQYQGLTLEEAIARGWADGLSVEAKQLLGLDWLGGGGIAMGPMIVGVGERGPEAILPLDALDQLLAREQHGGTSSRSGGNTYNVTIQAVDAASFRDFLRRGGMDEIVEAIERNDGGGAPVGPNTRLRFALRS